jgi:anthranilate phosphoribosyltransferase
MIRLPAPGADTLVDTCGTGGGSVQTFNISTAAALLAAGAGVRIAKHGNRSFTSRSGSADVLEALGVAIDAPLETMTRALTDAGIVFMFAPAMHPAMRHVGPVRRELGVPTVMNIVGPLANPAGAGRQVVGVAERSRMPLIAAALLALGTRHALVVHGEPGLDELSPLGPTHIIEVRDGEAREWTLDPRELGFHDIAEADLAGGSPGDNARIIDAVLKGRGPRGARAAVVLNAAAALYVGGGAPSIAQAISVATAALEAGEGAGALDRLRTAYSRESPSDRTARVPRGLG